MASKRARDNIQMTNRPRSGQATQALLQYIQTHQLKAGDRLPAQSELRRELGFSNDSLTTAMNALMHSGVLARKRGLGTVVIDPAKYVMGLWRVGVALLPSIAGKVYYGQLLLSLQTHLSMLGCTTTLYMLNQGAPAGSPELHDFGYLVDDLADGRLNGVLMMSSYPQKAWQAWWKKKIPILHVGSWENTWAGVFIAQKEWVREAAGLLLARGHKRLGIVSINKPDIGHRHFWFGFTEGLAEAGLRANVERDSFANGEGALGGARVARQLLALPPAQRPDGLIVIDDRIALGLTSILSEQGDYRPTMVVQTNIQAPQSFALPVIHVELDVDELAESAVRMLLEHMRNDELAPQALGVCPRMLSEDAVQVMLSSERIAAG